MSYDMTGKKIDGSTVKDTLCKCSHSKQAHIDVHPRRFIGGENMGQCTQILCRCKRFRFDKFTFRKSSILAAACGAIMATFG